jgi:Tfp pilus assembly protein PilX
MTATEHIADFLTVLVIAALLALPSVIGLLHDRRIDRQIRDAERRHESQRGVSLAA